MLARLWPLAIDDNPEEYPSLTAPHTPAAPALNTDAPYEKTTLPNGVRVVTGPMSGVRSASLIFYYNVGSRIEPNEIAGISHFLSLIHI